jgi:hypothetical protein
VLCFIIRKAQKKVEAYSDKPIGKPTKNKGIQVENADLVMTYEARAKEVLT